MVEEQAERTEEEERDQTTVEVEGPPSSAATMDSCLLPSPHPEQEIANDNNVIIDTALEQDTPPAGEELLTVSLNLSFLYPLILIMFLPNL